MNSKEFVSFCTMTDRIQDLEANYMYCYQQYLLNPIKENLDKLICKQIAIDEKRHEEKESLRWYTSVELRVMNSSPEEIPDEPREPLDISAEDNTTAWAERTPFVKINPNSFGDMYSLRLDSVIQRLQRLREKLGGDVAVWYLDEAEARPVTRVSKCNDGVLLN